MLGFIPRHLESSFIIFSPETSSFSETIAKPFSSLAQGMFIQLMVMKLVPTTVLIIPNSIFNLHISVLNTSKYFVTQRDHLWQIKCFQIILSVRWILEKHFQAQKSRTWHFFFGSTVQPLLFGSIFLDSHGHFLK